MILNISNQLIVRRLTHISKYDWYYIGLLAGGGLVVVIIFAALLSVYLYCNHPQAQYRLVLNKKSKKNELSKAEMDILRGDIEESRTSNKSDDINEDERDTLKWTQRPNSNFPPQQHRGSAVQLVPIPPGTSQKVSILGTHLLGIVGNLPQELSYG